MAGIHLFFLTQGEAITSTPYSSDIDTILQKLVKKQPGLVNKPASVETSYFTTDYEKKNN